MAGLWAGGLGFTLDVTAPIGRRISDLRLLRSGAAIEPSRNYVVAGWASVNENTQGPPVWELVMRHITAQKTVRVAESRSVKIVNP